MNTRQQQSFIYCSQSDTGRIRTNNEDSYLELPDAGVWAVADGMGGHASGEVASKIVIHTLQQAMSNKNKDLTGLESALNEAHAKILLAATDNPELLGMGSTAVALKIEGQDYEIAWVGDSRAYCWTPASDSNGGELLQLTTDHSLVQALVDKNILTQAEAAVHPEKHVITQCLGAHGNNINVDKVTGRLGAQQWLLLCSDGLTNELSDQDIADTLAQAKNIPDASTSLLNAALAAGGKDNITLQIVGQAPTGLLTGWIEKVKTTLQTTIR